MGTPHKRRPAALAARGASNSDPPAQQIRSKHKAESLKFQQFGEWPEQPSPQRIERELARTAAEQAAIEAPTNRESATGAAADNVVDIFAAAPVKRGPISPEDEKRLKKEHAARMFASDLQIANDPKMRKQDVARRALSFIRSETRWWSGVAEVDLEWLTGKVGCTRRGLQKGLAVAKACGHVRWRVRNGNLSNVYELIVKGRTAVHPSEVRGEPQFTPDANASSSQTRTPVHPSTLPDSLGRESTPSFNTQGSSNHVTEPVAANRGRRRTTSEFKNGFNARLADIAEQAADGGGGS
jgi:hypothetical protein